MFQNCSNLFKIAQPLKRKFGGNFTKQIQIDLGEKIAKGKNDKTRVRGVAEVMERMGW